MTAVVTAEIAAEITAEFPPSQTGDGLRLCPLAQLDDGRFDVTFNRRTVKSSREALGIFSGVKAL